MAVLEALHEPGALADLQLPRGTPRPAAHFSDAPREARRPDA